MFGFSAGHFTTVRLCCLGAGHDFSCAVEVYYGALADAGALRRAFRAKSAENKFTIAHDSFTQGARGRPGHVVPFKIFDISAAVADEVMMQQAVQIVARGSALDRHFTHQSCLHQVTQIVISGGL